MAGVGALLGITALVVASLTGEADDARTGAEEVEADPATGELRVQIPAPGGVSLSGTLRLPASIDGPVAAIVVVPGFGPTDRDGVAPPGAAPDRLYADLAEALADAGIASFRYDKRGTPGSPLPDGNRLRFDDRVGDVQAALDYLAGRHDVDAEALALIGHDEGGLVALRAAAADARVTGAVLLATPGRPLVEVLADDLANGAADEVETAELTAELRHAVDGLLTTGSLPVATALSPQLRVVLPGGEDAYLRGLFAVDPAVDAASVEVPVLVVIGGADSGVRRQDADRLLAALDGRGQVILRPHAGHTLAIAAPAEPTSPTTGAVTGDDEHESAFHTGVAGIQRDDEAMRLVAAWTVSLLDR